eukprot:365431-Chlamydomonas_euryale.AAC.29
MLRLSLLALTNATPRSHASGVALSAARNGSLYPLPHESPLSSSDAVPKKCCVDELGMQVSTDAGCTSWWYWGYSWPSAFHAFHAFHTYGGGCSATSPSEPG